jgi:peptidyl-prolyl cis-trans isomerase D
MLDALRRGSSGIVAKALLTVLILSFAVWGVADFVRGPGAGHLAKVGNVSIGQEEFQNAYQNQLQMLGQLGRRLTPDQARQFGLHIRALYGLIDTAAVDNHAKLLHLGVSPETVAQQVAREGTFRRPDGTFDRAAFDNYLRQIRMSEAAFIAARSKDEVREQLTGTLASSVAVPEAMIASVHAWREETRKLEFLTLPVGAVSVPAPDDAKLKETYEASKRNFMVPEQRKLAVLLLEQAELKARVSVAEDEIKEYFEKNRAQLDIPERRRINQITFKDMAAAEAGKKAIEGGKGFLMLALETEGAAGHLPGLAAKNEIGDTKLADAAFSLPKDKVSDIIQTNGGSVLLMVSEIVPGRARSLDEVKDEIKDRLNTDKINAELNNLHEAVDNNRNARKPLKEIGETLKLKYVEVSVDRANKTAEGKPGLEQPEAEAIVEHGFQGAVGVEAEPVELRAGGFAWVDVLAVTPEKEKPLEEVKADVTAVYTESTRRKLLSELAAKIVERANSGETLDAIAKEIAGSKVETTNPITRSTTPTGLSQGAVQIGFATAKGKAASAESADRTSRSVLKVVEINAAPPPTKEQKERISAELSQQMQGDAIQAYAVALRDKLGVTINNAALNRVAGGDRQQQ